MNKFLKKAKGWATGHGGMSAALTALILAVVVILNVIIYTLTIQNNWYLSAPRAKTAALSNNSEQFFSSIVDEDTEVTVMFMMPEEDVERSSTGAYVLATAKALANRHSFIKLRFVNLITKRDADTGEYVGDLLDKYSKNKDQDGNEVEVAIQQSSVIFVSGENHRVISGNSYAPFFTLTSSGYIYAYNGEEVMVSMISWVIQGEDAHDTVYITKGHGETIDPSFLNLLTCAGYRFEELDLRSQEVPEDAAMVLISNPTADFERGVSNAVRSELDRLEDYLYDRNGNLYVAMDPELDKRLNSLEDFLAERGFVMSGRENSQGFFERDIIRDPDQGISTDGYTFETTYASNVVASDIRNAAAKGGGSRVIVHKMGAIKTSGTAVPLLISSSDAETYAGGKKTDDKGNYAVAAYNEVKSLDGYSRILVTSGPYITSAEAMVLDGYFNKDFFYATFNLQFDSTAAPYGCMEITTIGTSMLRGFTMWRARLYTAIIIAIPLLIGVTGAVIIIRRKHR